MERYVIALDAMGGDHAPDATVGGAVRALRRFDMLRVSGGKKLLLMGKRIVKVHGFFLLIPDK